MSSLPLWISWCLLLAGISDVVRTEDRYSLFNFDLLQRVSDDVEGQVTLSPASAKVALMTLVEGTSGRTRQELLTVLRLPSDEYIIRKAVSRSLSTLKTNQNGTEIEVATRLWISPALMASTNYINILRNHYGTDVQQLNFGNMIVAANRINSWVRENTRNNIQSIVQPGTLSADTQMMLTSALYFKGQWLKAFDRNATRIRCFHVPEGGCRDIPMMENVSKYQYGYLASLDADLVAIPYSNGRTSMLIFLPSNEGTDPHLKILSKDVSYVPLRTMLSQLSETELVLSIPRFSIENEIDLRSPLMRMGINDIFNPAANFTGIVSNEYLRVGNIIQTAKIEINEEGTIAAAVTELSIIPLMGNIMPTFIANRPFIFSIVDQVTGEILFAGRFMGSNANNPTSSA